MLNNSTLGYVKALQHALYDRRYVSVDFLEVDYAAAAESFGCHGRRVTVPDDLSSALEEALECGKPAVLDVAITTDPARMLPGVDSRILEGAAETRDAS